VAHSHPTGIERPPPMAAESLLIVLSMMSGVPVLSIPPPQAAELPVRLLLAGVGIIHSV
jgi:hypothetical protein